MDTIQKPRRLVTCIEIAHYLKNNCYISSMMPIKTAHEHDSGNMKAKDTSPSLSENSISRNEHFETPEDLMSNLLTEVPDYGKCTVFLDFDDTIAFKFHPDGTSEQKLLQEISMATHDFEDCLRKLGECNRVISRGMVDILLQIQTYSDRYQLVIVTRRESGTEIQELFKESGLKEPIVLHQITLNGDENGSSMTMGGLLFKVEPKRSLTIDKGAIIGEWISQNRQSVQSAIFIDDIELNVEHVKKFLNSYEHEIHKHTCYGTFKDNIWRRDTDDNH